MASLAGWCVLASVLCASALPQVIEYESNGLKYQTLTRSGVTVMFAPMPIRVHTYAVVQASVSNGSTAPYTIRPEDFTFMRADGVPVRASAAASVVRLLAQKGGASDVLNLVATYEGSLYGQPTLRSTNGYEQRREAAILAGSRKFKAAATASAIALVQTRLTPGQSTDGAVFFETAGRPLGPGRLVVRTNTDTFEFKQE
jgi:hypothetical protein